jgi:8-oxo-dGTP diphosphatase
VTDYNPDISVATDAVVLSPKDGELYVLMVTRKHEPYKGGLAFPGGFLNKDETLSACSMRELEEETGLIATPVGQLYERSDPARDPRGRVITFPFVYIVYDCPSVTGADDAEKAAWYKVNDVDFDESGEGHPLAFDHADILIEALIPFAEMTTQD